MKPGSIIIIHTNREHDECSDEASEGRSTMGRKGHGDGFLGLPWHSLYGRVFLRIASKRCETASHEAANNFVFARQFDDTHELEHRNHMAKINDYLGLQLIPHAPDSPDLNPSDYYLFPNLKKWLVNKKFSYREIFSDGIKKLKNRWIRCIDLKKGITLNKQKYL